MDSPDPLPLIAAALLFVGGHLGISSTGLRPWLIGRLGRGPYLGLYSLLSLALLAAMVVTYDATPVLPLWPETATARWLALGLMPLSLILLVGGLTPDNPTLALHRADAEARPPKGMIAVTRHPMMWGIALTALLHILASGDLATLVFCGPLALLALVGARLQDRRRRAEDPVAWSRLAANTSFLPFLAIWEGRATPSGRALILPVVIGLALFGLMLTVHQNLFGVSPFR
jgi:uncharacterized membrane protein